MTIPLIAVPNPPIASFTVVRAIGGKLTKRWSADQGDPYHAVCDKGGAILAWNRALRPASGGKGK